MKKFISFLCIISLFSYSFDALWLDEKKVYMSILKIRTYEYNSTNNTYSISQMWSAVAIGSGLLLTNAHVIFDSTQRNLSGFYEICRTIDFRKKPVCFTTGDLVAYDEESDLALLRFREPGDLPTVPFFQENKINIGAHLINYGYPAIWWENISRTEGNVAGYEDPFYKIDGAIDHGSSGGGAFNKYGELIGVPSRVSSDNAVIGYMIPIMKIREFINKKTKGYIKASLKAPKDFKEFIKSSELGERSNDIINDANIKTVSLKRFGLKFLGKVEGINSLLYGFWLSNLSESSLGFACYHLGGNLSLENIKRRTVWESIKKYKETLSFSGNNGQYHIQTLESLLSSKGGDVINIYDTKNTCLASISNINIAKDKKIIDQAIAFIVSGITLKKSYQQTKGFDTQLFHIDTLPNGVVMKEAPDQNGDNYLTLGYFSPTSNTRESLSELTQKKKDTIDNYFLGSNSYFDNSPSDINLKSSEYSYETYRKLYEKEYTKEWFTNTTFTIEETRNKKKYIIGTTTYKDAYNKDTPPSTAIIFSYPYVTIKNDKKEYHELTYSNSYEWGNPEAISKLKDFFSQIELIGTAPF